MEIEFQNATIGLPQAAMRQSHLEKKFAGKRCYRDLKRHYRDKKNATIGLPQTMGQSHLEKKFAGKRRYRALKRHYRA